MRTRGRFWLVGCVAISSCVFTLNDVVPDDSDSGAEDAGTDVSLDAPSEDTSVPDVASEETGPTEGGVTRLVPRAKIATGFSHTCLVTSDTRVACFGRATGGRLGNDDPGATPTGKPVFVKNANTSSQLMGAIEVAAGENSSCALLETGAVRCWGVDDAGQLGNDEPFVSRLTAHEVKGIADAVLLSGAERSFCTVLASGAASCWGRNVQGQLGDGVGNTNHPVPNLVEFSQPVQFATSGPSHGCVIPDATRDAYCFGTSGVGPNAVSEPQLTPVSVELSHPSVVVQVAVGTAHSCALHEDGRVSCWGDNHYGQLGISPTPDAGALAPALIPETQLANAVHISSSRNHTCAVRQDGLVKCWGQDAMGALGDGGGSGEGVVEVLVIDDAEVVAAGSSHTCVARKSGAFSCWGSNSDGQLGLGTFGNMHAAPAGDVIDLP